MTELLTFLMVLTLFMLCENTGAIGKNGTQNDHQRRPLMAPPPLCRKPSPGKMGRLDGLVGFMTSDYSANSSV